VITGIFAKVHTTPPIILERPHHEAINFLNSMDKRTKQLFEWAASNAQSTETTDPPAQPSSKLDPGIINAILGPDDSQLMIEAMQAIKNPSLPLEDRHVPPEFRLT